MIDDEPSPSSAKIVVTPPISIPEPVKTVEKKAPKVIEDTLDIDSESEKEYSSSGDNDSDFADDSERADAIKRLERLRKIRVVETADFDDETKIKKSPTTRPSSMRRRSKVAVSQKRLRFSEDVNSEIGRAVQQECRDRSRMPSSA
eukprot:TRINITY_DN22436_c0_g2_i2.p1 TRINITY_DN22436_c0_g2~~TRINITY_DN22436_c0_g2_i2.p1  ORF type:complete len:146 (-),score=23.63 TRINITY_DN22436_c0_g2_i2:10-447(-)